MQNKTEKAGAVEPLVKSSGPERHTMKTIIRWIGKQVCKIKGHNYFHPGGLHTSWCAYTCVRCGELDRDIDTLPSPPEDEFFTDPYETMPEDYINKQYELERRWISWAPVPHWI